MPTGLVQGWQEALQSVQADLHCLLVCPAVHAHSLCKAGSQRQVLIVLVYIVHCICTLLIVNSNSNSKASGLRVASVQAMQATGEYNIEDMQVCSPQQKIHSPCQLHLIWLEQRCITVYTLH